MIILGIVIGVIFGIIIGACLTKVDASNENENTKPSYTPIERPTRAPIEKPTSTQTETLTKAQIENKKLKDNILEEMEIGRVYTITEMGMKLPCCGGISSQKIAALVRQLWVEEKVDRFEDNGKAYFALA